MLHPLPMARAAIAVFALLPLRIAAQERVAPPTDVAVVADGASAVVTWTPVSVEGVMYRVVRTTDVRRAGEDITEPVREGKVSDSKIEAGVTYFYQVIAVYDNAMTAASPFVSFTAPAVATTTTAPLTVVTAIAPTTIAMPTAVTGVTVAGNTTASAVVSWQPVPTAMSYSVKRSYTLSTGPTSSTIATGLTTTSWTDRGPAGVGFPTPGAYTYDVTASLAFSTVSGQGGWKRPDPTCAEPPSTQQPLSVLDPTKLASVSLPPIPIGATLIWQAGWSSSGAISLRLDRSVQGSGTWTPAGSSCDGTIPPSGKGAGMVDRIKGYSANTTYLYRLTSFAANGDIGIGVISWTSPNPSVIHWLSATVTGNSVNLQFRYELPATNPPASPSGRSAFSISAPYGFSQTVTSASNCTSVAGCSLVVSGVPSGTHVFTATAQWTIGSTVVAKVFASTTVVVP